MSKTKAPPDDLWAAIDTPAWRALEARYSAQFALLDAEERKSYDARLDSNYSKYFNLERFIPYHWEHVRRIGLRDEDRSRRVLDIGCGSGIFLALCQHLGHKGVGLDTGSKMYREMAETLKVDYRVELIHPLQPISADLQGFDWITAIATKFDREDFANPKGRVWNTADWRFFFHDMASRLNPGGGIYISANKWREEDRFPDRKNVLEYFDEIAEMSFSADKYIFKRERILEVG